MTWTYAEPSSVGWTDPAHEVRYLLGDTTQSAASPSDEVLRMLLNRTADAQGFDVYAAAGTAADSLADGFAGEADSVSKSTGNTSISRTYSSRRSNYRGLADRLWALARSRRPQTKPSYASFGLASGTQPDRQFAMGQFDTPGIPDGPAADPLPIDMDRTR